MATSAEAKVTTDHDEIRQWAEERGAQPSCVRGTGGKGDIGMLRLDFPGYSGEDSLEPISWDEWFEKFDERGLALLHQETTAGGERSNFNKLVSRETAAATESKRGGASRSSGATAKTAGGSAKKTAASKSAKKTQAKYGKTQAKSASKSGGGTSTKKYSTKKSRAKKASVKKASGKKAAKKTSSRSR